MKLTKSYEQELVSSYAKFQKSQGAIIFSENCRSKNTFDLKYELKGVTWCFEAKSHMSRDAYNGVHKLFGELLKDASRIKIENGKKMKLGLLLDARYSNSVKLPGFEFYTSKIAAIACDVLSEYGKIIKLEKVVFFNPGSKKVRWQGSWMDFINGL